MSKPADHISNVMAEAKAFAKTIQAVQEGIVQVTAGSGSIHVEVPAYTTKSPKKGERGPLIAKVKADLGKYLTGVFPKRVFRHLKHNGEKLWWSYVGNRPYGLKGAIAVDLTEEEHNDVLLGRGRW